MIFLYLVLSLDKTIEGINSILPIVSYRNMHEQIYVAELRGVLHMSRLDDLLCFV